MTTADILAIIALCVSGASLVLSICALLRERDRLRATSKFHPAHRGHPPSIELEAVNEGRRPIVLVALVKDFADGSSTAMPLGEGSGIRLDEKEKFSEGLYITDPDFLCNEEGCAATDLWFKDSVGRRYTIRNAREHLEQLIKNEASPSKGPES